jgi:3-methyladenine DNA glycosylase/8-oxoguanine DNA glycosylase
MRVIPAPATLVRLPPWEWHRAGVDGRRRQTLVGVARVAASLDRLAGLPIAEACTRLQSVPGIGPWTVGEVAARAFGDADAVPVGDFHLPTVVGLALAGRALDDAGMLAVLEPYRPQRYRAIRLVETGGYGRPRFGPRYPVRDNRRS